MKYLFTVLVLPVELGPLSNILLGALPYFIIFVILIIISFIIYIKYEESFELKKSKIPLKTVFINPGMILFIVYEIIQIIFNTLP